MCGAVGRSPMECRVGRQSDKTLHFHLWHWHSPTPEWPYQETGSRLTASEPVSDISAPACTNGIWPPMQPVCGAEEQTVNHVALRCSVNQPPHGLYRLTVLDDETINWLLNVCQDLVRPHSCLNNWIKRRIVCWSKTNTQKQGFFKAF